MTTFDRRALSWLRTHGATIPSVELERSGVTIDRRKRLVTDGTLARLVDGAYAFTGVELDEVSRCAALCSSRPHLVVCGPTAARLWKLRRAPRDGLVHVIAPPRSHPCREPWVRAYRTSLIGDDEIVERPDGIRVTSPPRTLVDLTRYVDDVALASAVEDGLARALCTTATLLRTAGRLDTRGRPWVRRFLEVMARRQPGAPAESEWERRVFDALVGRGVRDLRRQVPVLLPGYGRARFDMALPDLRWALEVDVHPEHRTPDGAAKDNTRDDGADAAGWFVRRVTDVELERNFERTLDAVVASVDRRRATVVALQAAGAWLPGGDAVSGER